MGRQVFANNASSVLTAGISAVATSIAITPADGVKFPTLSGTKFFKLTLTRKNTGEREVVRVSAHGASASTMTIARAKEGTAALTFVTGDIVSLRITRETAERWASLSDAVVLLNDPEIGAIGDNVADDSGAIQAAVDACAALGGGEVRGTPGCTYRVVSQLVKKPGVVINLNRSKLRWDGVGTAMFTSDTATILDFAGVMNGWIDSDDATKVFELFSAYQCFFRNLRITSNLANNFVIDLAVNTAGGTNADGNRNAAYNTFSDVVQAGTCGTLMRLNGGSSAAQVVTLNDFDNVSGMGVSVRGVDIKKWTDSNSWNGQARFKLIATGAVGVENNTDTPNSDMGCYANNFFGQLAIDSFAIGGVSGRIAYKCNFADQNIVADLVNDPVAEGGMIVGHASAGYDIKFAVPGTNVQGHVVEPADTRRRYAQAIGASYLLGRGVPNVAAPADTNDNTLASVTVPAGSLGPNGMLEVWASFTCTNNANLKTLRIKYDGAVIASKQEANTVDTILHAFMIQKNSNAAQFGHGLFADVNGGGATAITNRTIDSTVDKLLEISEIKAVGGDSVVLNAWFARLVSDGK